MGVPAKKGVGEGREGRNPPPRSEDWFETVYGNDDRYAKDRSGSGKQRTFRRSWWFVLAGVLIRL